MNKATPEVRDQSRQLRQAVAEAMALLNDAGNQLNVIIQPDSIPPLDRPFKF